MKRQDHNFQRMNFNERNACADLESQLSGVIEQDGITMISPEGVRRRARRIKQPRVRNARWIPEIFDLPENDAADEVKEMDVRSVGFLVRSAAPAVERKICVIREARPRSEYVISLKRAPLFMASESRDDRFFWNEAMEADRGCFDGPAEAGVYCSFTQDLTFDFFEPMAVSEQFTPNDFFAAHRSVYGRTGRASHAVRTFASDALDLFRRTKSVEREVHRDNGSAKATVEVSSFSPIRALAGFVSLMLIITIPANAVTLYRSMVSVSEATAGVGKVAMNELLSAKNAEKAPEAAESLKKASSRFREADAMLVESSALAAGLASVMPATYRSARALLESGDKASQAGAIFASGFEKVFSDTERRLDERLDALADYSLASLPLLSDASRAAASVKPSVIPEERREEFFKLKDRLESSTQAVRDMAVVAGLLSRLAGKNMSQKYLFVFQNNAELRPTGGFMGSVAEVTLDRGAVSSIKVPPGGPYDLKGQLLAHVISPEPLHLINPHWQFQDSNWFPDFPTSARKMLWFWSKSGQPTQNGVIAVNASFVEKVLDVTGPMEMTEYGKVIDKSNFMLETQKSVELEYDRQANTPKKFIGDLVSEMMLRMKSLSKDDWLKAGSLVSDALRTKDIQIYLADEDDEALVERYGWSGVMKDTDGDSLAVIETNIAGQKTDGVITESIEHVAAVQPDGSITDTLKVTRTHNGKKGELFRGVRNVSYVRAYVPLGSRFISADGFDSPPASLFKSPDEDYVPDPLLAQIQGAAEDMGEVTVRTEGSRTVFGGWAQLDPGETQTLTYRYRLPFTVRDLYSRLEASPNAAENTERTSYSLLLTSQSGKISRKITSSLQVPNGWELLWSHGLEKAQSGALYSGAWDQDTALAALMRSSQTAVPVR